MPLAADPAKLAIILFADAEVVNELAGRVHRFSQCDFEQSQIVGMDQSEEAAGGEDGEGRIEAEKVRQPRVDVHHVFGDAPFPDGGASGLDGTAEPLRVGDHGR